MSFEFVRVDFEEANKLDEEQYVFVGLNEGKLIFKKRAACLKSKGRVRV